MSHLEQTETEWLPKTESEKEAVLEQLGRIVGSPLFSQSKRYPVLLRYIVEQALAGRSDQLKERTIGIEVFHRPANYDTNLDPVVRFTAGEIRKRIAQYYFQPGHESELEIDVPSGSYVPEFSLRHRRPSETEIASLKQVEVPASPLVTSHSAFGSRRIWVSVSLLVVIAVAITGFALKLWLKPSELDKFWAPINSSSGSVIICIPVQTDALNPTHPTSAENQDPDVPMHDVERWMNRLALADATTLSKLASVVHSKSMDYRVRGDESITLEDLRHGPVVLIGAFDNDWTMRLTKNLRFSFKGSTSSPSNSITDRLNPRQVSWVVDGDAPYMKITEDYAIIARFKDQTSGSTVIVAAGLGEYGTLAAGDILSNQTYFKEVVRNAPPNWEKMNIEAVISTQVIDGNCGPPTVIQAYFW